MARSEQNVGCWLARGLCTRYALVVFDVTAVRIRDPIGCHELAVSWALGWLVDGECEPLGVWIDPQRSGEALYQMLDDLKNRGVERIWHATGPGIEPLQVRLAKTFPGATFDSYADPVLTEALAAARGRVNQPAELVAEQIRECLFRAFRRQRIFESETAAVEAVGSALQYMERQLDLGTDLSKVRLQLARRAQIASSSL